MKASVLALAITPLVRGMPICAPAGAQDIERAEAGEPRLMVRLAPRSPEAAVKARMSGHVTLEFTIGEGGVRDIVVIDSSDPIFHEEAIASVGMWRYFAHASDGTPVLGRRVRETFEFDIEKLEQYSR